MASQDTLQMLIRLKAQYGSLNRAMVVMAIEIHPEMSVRQLAAMLGVSRATVARIVQNSACQD